MGIAEDIIIIILVGLATGLIAYKLKIPPIIGYIVAGIIIGPHTGGVTVSDIHRIEMLAEIGVALLLFSIGLDFSFKELKAVRSIALIGTPIQILLLIGFGFAIGLFLNLPWTESLIFGMIISLSSTMVVIKNLMSRGLVGTLSSRVMIGILIIQDLAAIPLMLVIPELKGADVHIIPVAFTMLKSLLLLAAIIFIGLRIMPRLLKYVAKLNSRELFLISIAAIALGVGYLTHLFGLSMAFGAFVAGMVINESDYSRQALNDIIPLRDIFGLIFFTSVGMLVDPLFVYNNLSTIFILVLLVITGKFIIFYFLGAIFKYSNIIPLAMGLGLSQIGEFSFVLARTGMKNNLITNDFYSLVLSVSIITILASPFLSLLAAPIYSLKRKWFRHEQVTKINLPDGGLNRHVVIAGGGRVGFQIASVMHNLKFPFIIIEQDFRRFEKCKNAGFPIIYGEAGQEPVLIGAKIEAALLLIITIPKIMIARDIITTARLYNKNLNIIVRADDLSQADDLFKMNIFEVVQPEFEASLEIIRQALLHLDVPLTTIYGFTDKIRRQNIAAFRPENIQQSQLTYFKDAPFLLEMSWVEILEDSAVSGKSIDEMKIRTKTGVSVVGILRKSEFIPNPGVNFIFQPGDYIAIIGMPENKKLFTDSMISNRIIS